MNIHLAQITSFFPFHSDTMPRAAGRQDVGEILGVDTKRPPVVRALGRRVARFLAFLAESRRQAAEREQLARCTDRELADMGITRGDIGRIHDPRFAADFAAGRATSDSQKWL